jgi:hypothetical protein
MNADNDAIKPTQDKAAYRVDPCPALRAWVCQVSPGYPDTGHNKKNRYLRPSLFCLHPPLPGAEYISWFDLAVRNSKLITPNYYSQVCYNL